MALINSRLARHYALCEIAIWYLSFIYSLISYFILNGSAKHN